MGWFRESQNHLPLTWWKGRPIYLAAILALVVVAGMVISAVLGVGLLPYFAFSFENFFRHFYVWTPLTYALINPPSLWLIFDCLVIWLFGEGLERKLGRRALVQLVVALVAVIPILISLLGVAGMREISWTGIHYVSFGIFLAFATLHPRVQISLIVTSIDIWILAAVFVGIDALVALMFRSWLSLLLLAAEVGTAYGFVKHKQGNLRLPSWKALMPSRSPSPLLSTPRNVRPAIRARPATQDQLEVDDILDKISREGMHSLTPEERIILERASDDLQKRKR